MGHELTAGEPNSAGTCYKMLITKRESLQLLTILTKGMITLNKLSNGSAVMVKYSSPRNKDISLRKTEKQLRFSTQDSHKLTTLLGSLYLLLHVS